MDFKVKVKCENCRCKFEIRPGFLPSGKQISCPCCYTPLPSHVSDKIASGLKSFADVPENVDGFLISVDSFSPLLDAIRPE